MYPSLREEKIVVQVSGCDFVPTGFSPLNITEPGGKCIHGNYIPSNQEDQSFSESCHVCVGLRAFIAKTGCTKAEADLRVYCWMNYDHETAKKEIKRRIYGGLDDSNQSNTD
jgi:hypothetical protein